MFFQKCTANDWYSSKVKLTPAQCFLENYLQHPKKATSLIYIYIYTEWNDSHFPVHQMAWVTFDRLCKKAQKTVKKLERKYCTNNLCIVDAVQICNSSIHDFKYFFGKLERKNDLIHQHKVNKACEFVLYTSKQKNIF